MQKFKNPQYPADSVWWLKVLFAISGDSKTKAIGLVRAKNNELVGFAIGTIDPGKRVYTHQLLVSVGRTPLLAILHGFQQLFKGWKIRHFRTNGPRDYKMLHKRALNLIKQNGTRNN